MKKKIMAVTLCLAMASTFVVGCGQKKETDSGKSEEKSSGKVEIEFVQVKREAAESYTKVIEAFQKKNPDIVIKQNVVPDAQEVLMTRASSDNLPDLMNHWPTDAQFVQFEDEGLLLDLKAKIEEGTLFINTDMDASYFTVYAEKCLDNAVVNGQNWEIKKEKEGYYKIALEK